MESQCKKNLYPQQTVIGIVRGDRIEGGERANF